MARPNSPFIFKLKYYSPGEKNQNKNVAHLQYIGTRPGVDLGEPNFEEEELDAGKHLQYMDERPRSHGLFSGDETADLKTAKEEMAEHDGYAWRAIVSLREDDAIRQADDDTKKAQYFNILTWGWDQASKNRQERVILAVEEAYLLIDPEVSQALQFLRNTSKRIRKYEGGLWVISQNVVDFLDPAVIRYGQAILDNPTYKLLLAQGEKDLEALAQLMSLSEAESELLATAKRGEGLFVAGNQKIRLKVEAAPYEMEYLTGGGR